MKKCPDCGDTLIDGKCLNDHFCDYGRGTKGGPTEAEPDRPYCKPDQSCCDFCCGN